MLLDHKLFINEKNGKKVVFNASSFYKLLKGALVEYIGKTETEAELLLSNFHLVKIPTISYWDVVLYSHELPYHWIMIIVYGEGFWQNDPNISEIEPNDYRKWEKKFIKEHSLPEIFEYYPSGDNKNS